MRQYRADFHIHSILSPCGDLQMSPDKIISRAVEMDLDIIGITDHNSTRQCSVIQEMGLQHGIFVLTGVEVTTREEVHCLAFFENKRRLEKFQEFLDVTLPDIPNNTDRFGYQVVVDKENNIIFEEGRLLISALSAGIKDIEAKVHELEGLFIPAHADKSRFSLYSQLGFIPAGLEVDAFEVSPFMKKDELIRVHPELAGHPIIGGSDAHFPGQIGKRVTLIETVDPDFRSIRSVFKGNWQERIKVIN